MIRFAMDGFLRNGPVEFPWGSPIQLAKDDLDNCLKARMDDEILERNNLGIFASWREALWC
jgi:hypothetical protein